MRDALKLLGALGLVIVLGGCSHVASSMGGSTARTGDAWYVKTTSFPPGMVWSNHVYYCPAPASGQAKCTEAKMVEAE
jgi:hypothetical protein